ncbi:LysR family transcriptional regulator [Belnapia sp. T18]|uniref:LysR family transcriptional regulator n=1 Tax=Belnapia arida TaxID=2804533 RepID=A0ABS1U1K4_9PROT|nr:LysR substrate-binding domain-containing protein [Belnapia arida]MBL6078561.1 LysR family transcriptional regulator [Belnapia arida]
MRRLPLGAMEAFVAVARCGSLAEAAPGMGLTVPALSRRIRQIEAHLGLPLFRRLPRGLALTEAGTAYHAALAPAWEALQQVTEAARHQGRRQAIRISVMPSFAVHWLLPRLAGFQARHGGVEVEIETSAELADLRARPELDCAIRLGCGPWPGLASEPFLPVHGVPVASPGFPADLCQPRDLLQCALIGSHHQAEFWQEWFAAAGIAAVPAGCRSFDNLQLVYEAAAAGMGIALGLDGVVQPYLASGRLRPLLPAPLRMARQFHLVRRPGRGPRDRSIALLRDWLVEEAAAFAASAGLARGASLGAAN